MPKCESRYPLPQRWERVRQYFEHTHHPVRYPNPSPSVPQTLTPGDLYLIMWREGLGGLCGEADKARNLANKR